MRFITLTVSLILLKYSKIGKYVTIIWMWRGEGLSFEVGVDVNEIWVENAAFFSIKNLLTHPIICKITICVFVYKSILSIKTSQNWESI